MDESAAILIELGVYAVACVAGLFISIVLPAGYILWERKKKKDRSKGRASIGAALGLSAVDAGGGQDRLGGEIGGKRWVVGWEVRKVAGSAPKFVTFFECYAPSLPSAEAWFNPGTGAVQVSGQFGAAQPTGDASLDASFLCAGDVSVFSRASAELARLTHFGDDVYVLPDRVVLVSVGNHAEVAYLRERMEAVTQLVNALA